MNFYLVLFRVEFIVLRIVISRAVRFYRIFLFLFDFVCAGYRRFVFCCIGRGFFF